jgi:hypothetical protein
MPTLGYIIIDDTGALFAFEKDKNTTIIEKLIV